MQSKFTRLVFVFILYNYLIINETIVLFRYAVFKYQFRTMQRAENGNKGCKAEMYQFIPTFAGIERKK